jgi:hypothetical protein
MHRVAWHFAVLKAIIMWGSQIFTGTISLAKTLNSAKFLLVSENSNTFIFQNIFFPVVSQVSHKRVTLFGRSCRIVFPWSDIVEYGWISTTPSKMAHLLLCQPHPSNKAPAPVDQADSSSIIDCTKVMK